MARAQRVQLARTLGRTGRRGRFPKHPFRVNHRPFVIQPFFIAPVLPGETLKNLRMQSRVVTDPIQNPIIGWWHENYFFYVKLRDMSDRDTIVSMMIDPDASLSSLYDTAAAPQHYYAGGTATTPSIDWVSNCMTRVVMEYFRDEGESYTGDTPTGTASLVDNLPLATAFGRKDNWTDSLTRDDLMPDIDPNDTSAQSLEPQYLQWEYLRDMNMVDMSFEDYLREHGVAGATEPHRPELIRFDRQWKYPVNTVDPATGAPSSAVSWAITLSADKDRFFAEPGFLFGVTVSRPKVYMGRQIGTLTGLMTTPYSWLPTMLDANPEASLRMISNESGPASPAGPLYGMPTAAGGYWFDFKDLFLYGEQFLSENLVASLGATSADWGHVFDFPSASSMNTRYFSASMLYDFFVDEANASAKTYVRQDGIVQLAILGRQVETT